MKKTILLSIILPLTLPILLQAQPKKTRQEYIDTYNEIAVKQMKSHGIPASITLAQGCLESGDGNSRLATEGNNHFGIKCHKDWSGSTIRQDDDEKNECFRKYRRVEDSFEDHANFLRYRDRYSFLFDLPITDYKGWAYGLKKAGYATNPQYPQMLIKIIEDYNLTQYDVEAAEKHSKSHSYLPPSPTELQKVRELKPAKSSYLYKYSFNRTLYIQNGVAYIFSNENDTYESIAKEYNLFERELLSFNDLKSAPKVILPGTVVYIQKKKSRGQKHLDIHIAELGDTYYAISQRYAVRLEKISEYNNINPSDTPSEGDEILLRRRR